MDWQHACCDVQEDSQVTARCENAGCEGDADSRTQVRITNDCDDTRGDVRCSICRLFRHYESLLPRGVCVCVPFIVSLSSLSLSSSRSWSPLSFTTLTHKTDAGNKNKTIARVTLHFEWTKSTWLKGTIEKASLTSARSFFKTWCVCVCVCVCVCGVCWWWKCMRHE